MPIISIIMPVYNVERYLPTCIKSILEQSFSDYELIIVDDGSTDKCPEICDRYVKEDSRIKVIHKKNGGVSDARNVGLEAAKGKYIGFVDGDDFIHRKMFEILLSELEKEDADFVKSNFIPFYDDDELLKEKKSYTVTSFTPLEAIDDFFTTKYSSKKPMKSVLWDGLYKREIFFNENTLVIKFPVGKIHEDTYVFPELIFRAKKIIYVDAAFYYYRKRKGSIVHSEVNLQEIESRNLWKHIECVVSEHTDKYRNICVENLIIRNINLSRKTYSSCYKKDYFEVIRTSIIDDAKKYKNSISDQKIKRTVFLIRFYPLYLVIKKLFRNKIY